MKACLKRPCPEPTSPIQNVGTNIIDELIETLEGNQHLAKQLKVLKYPIINPLKLWNILKYDKIKTRPGIIPGLINLKKI